MFLYGLFQKVTASVWRRWLHGVWMWIMKSLTWAPLSTVLVGVRTSYVPACCLMEVNM